MMNRRLSVIFFALLFTSLGQNALSLEHQAKDKESSYTTENNSQSDIYKNDFLHNSDKQTKQTETAEERQIEESKEKFYNNQNFKVKYSSRNWDKEFEKIKNERPAKIGTEFLFSPYVGFGFGGRSLFIMNEGITADVAFGSKYAKRRPIAGLNVGLLHASALGKSYTCRYYVNNRRGGYPSRGNCRDVEGILGNYVRTSGRFGIIFGESSLKNIRNRLFVMTTADIGAIIPLNKNLKKVKDYTREAELRSSFIGELGITFGFSIFHTSLMYRYVGVMETHEKRAKNISQFLWTFGLIF